MVAKIHSILARTEYGRILFAHYFVCMLLDNPSVIS